MTIIYSLAKLGVCGDFFRSSTGLYKFGSRYYDHKLGRWTQQDPVGGSIANPNSGNAYVYADNEPNMLTDPSGRDAFSCIFGTIVGAAVGLSVYPYLIGALDSFAGEVVASIIAGTLGVTGGILLIVGFVAFIGLVVGGPIILALYGCFQSS